MYLAMKTLHVLAVVAFLGNITIGLYWKRIADRTGDAAIVAHTMRGIILADRLITIPSIVVLLAAGIGVAILGGFPILGTGWILWGIVLFVISGAAFGPVARAQRGMLAAAATGLTADAERKAYAACSFRWDVWGSVATIAPLIALVLMVVKPDLPHFHH